MTARELKMMLGKIDDNTVVECMFTIYNGTYVVKPSIHIFKKTNGEQVIRFSGLKKEFIEKCYEYEFGKYLDVKPTFEFLT